MTAGWSGVRPSRMTLSTQARAASDVAFRGRHKFHDPAPRVLAPRSGTALNGRELRLGADGTAPTLTPARQAQTPRHVVIPIRKTHKRLRHRRRVAHACFNPGAFLRFSQADVSGTTVRVPARSVSFVVFK